MSWNAFYPLSCLTLLIVLQGRTVSLASWLPLLAVVWVSVAVHEAGHVLATRWTGGTVFRVRVLPWHGVTSVRQSGPLSGAFVALAGPFAGILASGSALALLGSFGGSMISPSTAVMLRLVLWAGVIDNLLNLMPLWILDGRVFVRHVSVWMSNGAAKLRPTPASRFEDARAVEELIRAVNGMPANCPRDRTSIPDRGAMRHRRGARVPPSDEDASSIRADQT